MCYRGSNATLPQDSLLMYWLESCMDLLGHKQNVCNAATRITTRSITPVRRVLATAVVFTLIPPLYLAGSWRLHSTWNRACLVCADHHCGQPGFLSCECSSAPKSGCKPSHRMVADNGPAFCWHRVVVSQSKVPPMLTSYNAASTTTTIRWAPAQVGGWMCVGLVLSTS